MSTVDRDIRIIGGLALLCAGVVLAVPVTAVRTLFAVPLCLVLPGYALTAATFPRRQLTGLQTLALTIAMSLSTLVLGSLILDLAGGLYVASWTVLLLVVVGVACAVTVNRRGQVMSRASRIRWTRPLPSEIILLAFAALAISTALLVSRVSLGAPNAYGYTQLWMVQSGTQFAPAVRIGVRSGEKVPATYRVVLTTASGRSSVATSNLALRPGEARELNVSLRNLPVGQSVVTANLYVAGKRGAYRTVTAVVQSPIGRVFAPPDQPSVARHRPLPPANSAAGGRASRTGQP